jgi:hypothetical protein
VDAKADIIIEGSPTNDDIGGDIDINIAPEQSDLANKTIDKIASIVSS